MIDFTASTFTWKSHPWQPDPHYRYTGGFVGQPGQVYHVRFNLESSCVVEDGAGRRTELFLGSPCRSEYTIASRNLFQIPSNEWRMAFSRESIPSIARRPSTESEPATARQLADVFQDYAIDIRGHDQHKKLTDATRVVGASLASDLLNGRSTYRQSGFDVTVEFPVNLINVNVADGEFQVCTGPMLLPDLATWDGGEIHRVFLAHVAFSTFDHVEFILRREVEVAGSEAEWLDRPRGRDRQELLNPDNPPAGHPLPPPRPKVYSEVWELEARNALLRAPNRSAAL